MEPGIFKGIPADVYHADPCQAPSLSSSIIKILLNQSPLHAWTAHPRLNPNFLDEVGDDETKFDIGTAAHSLVLEGIDKIAVIDATDWRTKEAKEARDIAREEGLTPLLVKHAVAVCAMVSIAHESIRGCKDLSGITLDDCDKEVTIIWQEDNGVWCRGRIDALERAYAVILDYKSTQASAEPNDAAKRVLDQMSAHIQAAFYLRGLEKLTGKRPPWAFANQEARPPYACSFVGLSPSYLALGEDKVLTAIDMWGQCLKSGKWPGYSNRIHYFEPKPWTLDEWCNKQDERKQDLNPEYLSV